ncbi:MAG TPA: hypothetical protein VGG33_02440 [Polyangia bacterium]
MSDLPPKTPPAASPPPAPVPSFDPGPLPDEFAHIPSRPARPPLLALGAALLALFLAVRMRDDVSFALSSRTPIELGDGRALANAGPGQLPLNRLVRITGRPERASAVVLDARGSWRFTQVFRLRGTHGKIFVRRVADPLPVPLADRDVFVGRLVGFDDLSFAGSISEHFASRVLATHFFAPRTLAEALSTKQLQLRDLGGDIVTLGPDDRLAIDIGRPDTFTLQWPNDDGEVKPRLTQGPVSDAAAVRAIVIAAGGAAVDESGPGEKSGGNPRLTVTIPGPARDAVMSKIEGLGRGLQMRPARDSLEVSVRDLSVTDDGWRLGVGAAARVVPVGQIISIRTRAPVKVPEGAALLVEGETPSGEVKSLVVLAFLAAFAAVNLLSLRRPRAL